MRLEVFRIASDGMAWAASCQVGTHLEAFMYPSRIMLWFSADSRMQPDGKDYGMHLS